MINCIAPLIFTSFRVSFYCACPPSKKSETGLVFKAKVNRPRESKLVFTYEEQFAVYHFSFASC